MALEAPYVGRNNAPASADKASAIETDKPDPAVEAHDEADPLTATRHDAPQDETVAEEAQAEEVVETDEEETSPEAPDANLILMRKDYTKKAMEVAEQRRQIEAREASLQERYGVYERVDALIDQNPQLAHTHTVEQLVAMLSSPTAPQTAYSLPPEVQRELAGLKAEQRELKEELFADKVQASMKRLKRDYALSDTQVKAVVEAAVADDLLDYNTPPSKIHSRLDLVASKVGAKRASVNGQKKLVRQLVEKGRAASVGTSGPATDSEASRPRVKGWENLIKQAQADLKSRRTG